MPSKTPEQVHERLKAFLRRRISRVHFARTGGVPPQLAYITPFARLSLPLAGTHPMLIAGKRQAERICPGAGEAVFVRANRWNKPDWSEPGTVLTLLFGKNQTGLSLTVHEGSGEEPEAVAKVSLVHPLEVVTSQLVNTLLSLSPGEGREHVNCRVVEALLHAILGQLEALPGRQMHKARRTYEAICLYVQENAQRPLSRALVAERFGLSESHVSRIFRSEGAMRFCDYLNLVRINRAKVLLTDGRSTVKEVADDCGYADSAYFCRVFLRFVRMTPTEYRASRR